MVAGAESGHEKTYQWLLRALGAYLDEQPSCRISLAEVSDGFVVRMQRALHKLEPEVEHFTREQLITLLHNLMGQKKQPVARHQGIWGNFPNGHQDFFRALGYELDESKAKGILVDELEDGIVVTYTRRERSDGLPIKKEMIILSLEDIETILNAAFERRGKALPPTA